MLETIQKLVPWLSGLPLIPRIVITAIAVLLCFAFLYLIWVPPPKIIAEEQPAVKQAYGRMKRVLSRLSRSANGKIAVEGTPIEDRLSDYYTHYIAIAEYIEKNPENIKGAYEEIWAHGGAGRVMINDTEAFETVVSAFFEQYERAGTR